MRLELSVLSKPGGRKRNEDAYGIWSDPATGACFCAIADGAGGHGGGDVASKLAVEHSLGWFRQHPDVDTGAVEAALAAANRAVLDGQAGDDARLADMRATAVLLAIDTRGMKACWGHLGDSRLYYFRDGRLVSQTRDHSVLQNMVDAGYVAPAELRKSVWRSKLFAALGQKDEFTPTVMQECCSLDLGDAFLLCTDGLWEVVSEEEMERLLRERAVPEEWLRGLENLLLARASRTHDNYSAIAVHCG